MRIILTAFFVFLLSVSLFSCQKEVAQTPPATPQATITQSPLKEFFLTGQPGTMAQSTRYFDRDFTAQTTGCNGELIDVAGSIHILQTVVSDITEPNDDGYWDINKSRYNINVIAEGKTTDGETFRIHTGGESVFSNGEGHFVGRSQWRTAHHSGTMVVQSMGTFNPNLGTVDFRIERVYSDCQ